MDNQEPSPGPVIPIMVSKGALADPGSHAAVAASGPRPSRGTCLPLCTAARGHSHMATTSPMHTITHSYPVLSSGSCSHLHYLGHGAHGHTCMSTPLPTHNILILPYIYVHVHTNSTMGTRKYVLTPALSTPAHLSHLQSRGSNYRREHLVSTSHASDSVLRTF